MPRGHHGNQLSAFSKGGSGQNNEKQQCSCREDVHLQLCKGFGESIKNIPDDLT